MDFAQRWRKWVKFSLLTMTVPWMYRQKVFPETMEVLFSVGWPYGTQDIAE